MSQVQLAHGNSSGSIGKLQDGALNHARELLGRTEWEAVRCSQEALRAEHQRNDLVSNSHEAHRGKVREINTFHHEQQLQLTEAAHKADEALFAHRTENALDDQLAARRVELAERDALRVEEQRAAWDQKARSLQERAHARAQRGDAFFKLTKDLEAARVKEADANADLRIARAGNRMAEVENDLRRLDDAAEDQFRSVEAGVDAGFRRKEICAGAVKHDARVKVRQAMDSAAQIKASALAEILASRQEMEKVIRESKEDRWEALREGEAAIYDEDVCTRRSESLALEMVEGAQEFCELQAVRKDQRKAIAERVLGLAVANGEDDVLICEQRLDGVHDRKERRFAKERAHMEKEAIRAEEKVEFLEGLVERYEKDCKVREERVADEWSSGDNLGDSRRSAVAVGLAEDSMKDFDHRLEAASMRREERTEKARNRAKVAVEAAQARLRKLEELADSRVKTGGSAALAEAERLESHVAKAEVVWAEMEARIDDRVREQNKRSIERVDMARRRCEGELAKTTRRREDAQGRRDDAHASNETAGDKVRFAIAYLRATGFDHYADEMLLRPVTPDSAEEVFEEHNNNEDDDYFGDDHPPEYEQEEEAANAQEEPIIPSDEDPIINPLLAPEAFEEQEAAPVGETEEGADGEEPPPPVLLEDPAENVAEGDGAAASIEQTGAVDGENQPEDGAPGEQ